MIAWQPAAKRKTCLRSQLRHRQQATDADTNEALPGLSKSIDTRLQQQYPNRSSNQDVLKCPYSCDCTWKGDFAAITSHLKSVHLTEYGDCHILSTNSTFTQKYTNRRGMQNAHWATLLVYEGVDFLWEVERRNPGSNSRPDPMTTYGWEDERRTTPSHATPNDAPSFLPNCPIYCAFLRYVGPAATHATFSYSVTVEGNGRSRKMTFPVRSAQQHTGDYFIEHEDCFILTEHLALYMSEGGMSSALEMTDLSLSISCTIEQK